MMIPTLHMIDVLDLTVKQMQLKGENCVQPKAVSHNAVTHYPLPSSALESMSISSISRQGGTSLVRTITDLTVIYRRVRFLSMHSMPVFALNALCIYLYAYLGFDV